MRKSKLSALFALAVSFLLSFGVPAQAAGIAAAAASARSAVQVSPVALPVAMPGGAASLSLTQGLSAPSLTTSLKPLSSILPTLMTHKALPSIAASNALPAALIENVQISPLPSLLKPVSSERRKDAFAAKANAFSAGVKNAVSSVGSISKTSPSSAHALGSRLMGILARPFGGDSEASVSPQKKTGFRSSGLKASGEAGADDSTGPTSQEATKRQMVRTLEYVASVFSGHYAPLGWKEQRFDVDLKKEFEKAVSFRQARVSPTRPGCPS